MAGIGSGASREASGVARVFSGIQPSGDVHLGNLVGAIARWAAEQQDGHVFCIVDLHAITVAYEPHELRARTLDLASWILAAGLDPDVVTLFVQSHVREHAELAWVLGCVTQLGELQRMTQFKQKSEGRAAVSAGLFTYPVLQAADILLYDTDEVPVGEDQRQHVELTRDVAQRFNSRFGETLVLPQATLPKAGARVMDLQRPADKMSKSNPEAGTILLADTEARTRKKIMRAVTDSGTEVRPGDDKPEITNLLDLFSAVTGATSDELAERFAGRGYGALKSELAEAVNGYLRPLRARQAELAGDPAELEAALGTGADRAREVATDVMARVRERAGFVHTTS
jgi:tryptophanyl-tRNA synthetase